MYRFVLLLSNDEPYDPPCFVTPVSEHRVGAQIRLKNGRNVRIAATHTATEPHMRALGFSGVFTVEPVE